MTPAPKLPAPDAAERCPRCGAALETTQAAGHTEVRRCPMCPTGPRRPAWFAVVEEQ